MKRKQLFRKALSTTLAIMLLIIAFVPFIDSAGAASNVPTAVNGRILPTSLTGDSSTWVEIARVGNHSLILRTNAIQKSGFGSTNQYSTSTARTIVNNWFNNTLGSNARMREYTMQNNALSQLGAWTNTSSGFSMPSAIPARTGNDVAFLLSFAEASAFCSTQYAPSSTNYLRSSSAAVANFNRLTPISGGQPTNHWWLRSPGDPRFSGSSGRASTVGFGGFNDWGNATMQGAVNQYQISSNIINVRPALWVDSGIFDTHHIVSYNPNGGFGSIVNASVATGTGHTVVDQGYTRDGFILTGFNTAANGTGTSYNVGQSFTVRRNVTLFAQWQWQPIPYYTVIFDSNGGTPVPSALTVREGQTITEPIRPTRPDLAFFGWYTDAHFNGRPWNFSSDTVNENITLYARWVSIV